MGIPVGGAGTEAVGATRTRARKALISAIMSAIVVAGDDGVGRGAVGVMSGTGVAVASIADEPDTVGGCKEQPRMASQVSRDATSSCAMVSGSPIWEPKSKKSFPNHAGEPCNKVHS